MKCVVIYSSVTGNTEKVAKAIQAGVKQEAGHCDILKIKEANPRRLYQYDLIGLGSPMWGALAPHVESFIKNMSFVGGKHVFAFCTHGTAPKPFSPSIVPKLKRRGLIVIGTRGWHGDCFLPIAPRPYWTGGHPDEIDLQEAEVFGREMVEHSERISAGETDLIPPVPRGPVLRAPSPGKSAKSEEFPQSFVAMIKYHKEKCKYPKCRLCMDNCPMNGIDLSIKPPVIAKPCFPCEFCVMICPTGALDASDFHESMKLGMISSDMKVGAASRMAEAEAEGSFRRLVPEDEIGYDTPLYTVITKHPMWIIGKGLNI